MSTCLVVLVSLTFLITGCSSIKKQLTDPSHHGPFRNQYNCGGAPAEVLRKIQRVAILPTAAPEQGSASSAASAPSLLHQGLVEEFRSATPFEVVLYPANAYRLLEGPNSLRVTEALPPQLLKETQRQTDAEVALFSSVTAFQTYPPLMIGIKVTLVRIQDGEILWQFDDTLNAGDGPTLNDARRFLRQKLGIDTEPPPSPSVDSPTRFTRFAASVVARMFLQSRASGASEPDSGSQAKKDSKKRLNAPAINP